MFESLKEIFKKRHKKTNDVSTNKTFDDYFEEKPFVDFENELTSKTFTEACSYVPEFDVHIASVKREVDFDAKIKKISKETFENIQYKKISLGLKQNQYVYIKNDANGEMIYADIAEITSKNIALALHPFVWQKLSLKEKMTATIIALKEYCEIDLTKSYYNENDNKTFAIYEGEVYVNNAKFTDENLFGNKLFTEIINLPNKIKEYNYKINHENHKRDVVDTIYNYKSFEELRYLNQAMVETERFDNLTPLLQAYILDFQEPRDYREAELFAIEELLKLKSVFKDAFAPFTDYANHLINEIVQTEIFINKNLGFKSKERDKKYLELVVEDMNNRIESFNKSVTYAEANGRFNMHTTLDLISDEDAIKYFADHFENNKTVAKKQPQSKLQDIIEDDFENVDKNMLN